MTDPADPASARAALLASILAAVPFDGWTQKTLLQAETGLGLHPGTVAALFPDGVAGVLDFWHQDTDRQMMADFAALDPAPVRTGEKVKTLVMLRLTALAPHREAAKRAAAWYLANGRPLALSQQVWKTADEIWHLAGDAATDFNWYSKRALLSGVYSATFPVWLQDETEDLAATRAFLERRLQDVARIPKATAPLRRACDGMGALLTRGLSRGTTAP